MSKCEKVKLGDVCDVRDGTHDSPKYIERGFPLITSKNLSSGNISLNNVNYISELDFIKINERSLVHDGDILMPMIGTIGNPVIVNKTFDFAIKNVALIKCHEKEQVYNKFISYVLSSNQFERYIDQENRGGTQKFISLSNIRKFQFSLPSIEEQKKIAEILDKANNIINLRKEQIMKLELLIKSRFVELFGSPETNPFGWEETTVGKYLNILTDYHSNGSYETLRDNVTLLDEQGYALMVRTTDLEKANFEEDVKYIDEHAYNHLVKSKVFGGEIIINKIGSAGKVYLMPCLNRPVSLAMNQFLLRFDERKVNHIFIYYLLMTPFCESKIRDRVRGAVTKTLTKDAVREVEIYVPPLDLQNQFATFVQKVDKLKASVQKSLNETQILFDSLMQQYFV